MESNSGLAKCKNKTCTQQWLKFIAPFSLTSNQITIKKAGFQTDNFRWKCPQRNLSRDRW